VVGECHKVLELNPDTKCYSILNENSVGIQSDLWTRKQNERKSLLIISTPYRDGHHIATNPSDFISIIDLLLLLHEKGFVHGDVRGYNTVIGINGTPSMLIDFDFGGKVDHEDSNPLKTSLPSYQKYPTGYHRNLDDGIRKGKADEPILKWHDWHALGNLIFFIHKLAPVSWSDDAPNQFNTALYLRLFLLEKRWVNMKKYPTPYEIQSLKEFLAGQEVQQLLASGQWIYTCNFDSHSQEQVKSNI
jgi:serine/threonine protein kinase